MMKPGGRAVPSNGAFAGSRAALVAGFGGLLLLMAWAGADAIRALRQIQNANDAIREDFLQRTRILERIRADLYVSGSYVRDYLLESDAGRAEGHRDSLAETRRDMEAALTRYRALLTPREKAPFQILADELAGYWKVLEPVFAWDTARRQNAGYSFLRDEVFPRRASMLSIADRIAEINELQMKAGNSQVRAAFLAFERRQILAVLVTTALGAALAAYTVRRTLALEARAAHHYREIATARGELERLSTALVKAQESERRSISRELHDEVGQSLTGALVEMANLTAAARAASADAVVEKATEIKRLLEGSISVVRDMALLLRPPMLDDLGLAPALHWQAREMSRRIGVRVRVSAEGISEDLPEDLVTCVYRVVQEALHNVARHAAARNAKITVAYKDAMLLLTVEDDGRGFDSQLQRGMGLLGIRERAAALGGTFTMESQPNSGTTLRVALPAPAAKETRDPHPAC